MGKWYIQVLEDGKPLQVRGKPYFEKECSVRELLESARDYLLKEKENEKV